MAGMTRWSAPSKGKARTNPPSLSMRKQVLGFPTYPKATRLSESVDCAVRNSSSVCTSSFSLSVIHASMQTSEIKGTKGFMDCSMVSSSDSTVKGAHAGDLGNIVRTGTSTSNRVQFLTLVLGRGCASPVGCFMPTR